MDLEQVLQALEAGGARLTIVDGRLSCDAPQGLLTPALRTALATHKDALLARLQSTCTDIPHLPRSDSGLPLSPAQRRLWLLDQLEGGSPRYNLVAASRILGPLDPAALQQALRWLVQRHEILRTRFVLAGDEPLQWVDDNGDAAGTLAVQDVSGLPADERAAALTAAMEEESRFVFDLSTPPLTRTRLLRLAPDEAVLISNQHHIISDGWSRDLFARELALAYAAFATGQQPALAPLPVQYADFAAWQERAVAGNLADEIAFWRQELDGLPALLPLPTDFPRPARQRYRGGAVPIRVDAALTGQLADLARRHAVSLFQLLQALLLVCLHRHSGARDLAIGVPVAGRTHPASEHLIGCFVNSLVLRCRLDPGQSFSQLLQDVKAATLRALAHQNAPFERLVEALQPRRDLSYAPLFQVLLTFLSQRQPSAQPGGWQVERLDVVPRQALFDLDWQLRETDNGIEGYLVYASDLFTQERAAGMANNFVQAMQAVVAHPGLALEEIDILPTAERQRLLHAFNATATDYPREARVERLFEAQAARSPQAIAVSGSGLHWRYHELDQRANALAHALRARGVTPGARVGLCLRRSPRMLAALLAVLKAGAAYVPLDPGFPPERLAFMAQDAGLALVVCEPAVEESLRQRLAQAAPMLDLDTLPDALAEAPPAMQGAMPADTMYMIYTSGSTGQPKGVALGHRSVVNFLASMARQPGICGDDTLLAVTTLSFDIAVLELFLPLLHGARVALVSQEASADPRQLMRMLEEERVTIMQATPATWRLLLAAGWLGKSDLTVLCGGEALPRDLSARLLPCCRALWNMYGPTETTVWSAIWRVPSPATTDTDARGAEPIGRPIANTRVYVLDHGQRLLPAGAAGELWIGGDGLALGYHGRPDLTAERFLADPFTGVPGTRMYRTGDSARWRGDGVLEFLGRLDHQVKLRGYRIELGEIESALGQHPLIAHCAVTIREDTPGDQRLCAYLVASGEAPATEELRRYLRQSLPEYMLPAHFTVLSALPLTANGKVDRARLPRPTSIGAAPPAASSPRANAQESRIAALWSDILQTPAPGADANFFDLGGHSLLLIRLHQRLRETFGVELKMLDLFHHATIRRQAALIAGAPQGAPDPREQAQAQADRQRQALQRQQAIMRERRIAHSSPQSATAKPLA
jgi:amino acid adenylation domain-containing protein